MNRLNSLRFETGMNYVQLDAQVEDDASLQSFGDLLITLNVCSNGFAGNNEVWIQREEAEGFYRAMALLEESLQGQVTLTSMSPGELTLNVLSVSRRGHIAVSGSTGYIVRTENAEFSHSVAFGFEFELTQLTTALRESWISRYASD